MDDMTRQQLADRYGISRRAIDIWLRKKNIQPVNPGEIPARFRVTEVDTSRVAAGLMRPDTSVGPPPGTATVSLLASILDVSRDSLMRSLRRPDAPQPAGYARPSARARRTAAYYGIGEVATWYGATSPRRKHVAEVLLAGPEHGTQARFNRMGCRCPVCQSAQTAFRERVQGRPDRLTQSAGRLAGIALDPGTDAERVAMIAKALADPIRVEMLRVVAACWPNLVPTGVVARHLQVLGEQAMLHHLRLLVQAGFLAQGEQGGYRYVWAGRE